MPCTFARFQLKSHVVPDEHSVQRERGKFETKQTLKAQEYALARYEIDQNDHSFLVDSRKKAP